jgi:hypothetical protein
MAVLAPDAERVVSDYLRTHSAVAAYTTSIRGAAPDDTSHAWVKVTQLSGSQGDPPDHLIEHYFQFDCYAGKMGGQPEAVDLARTVRMALVEISRGSHSGAVVTRGRIDGFARVPDDQLNDDRGHARERVIITASVWMHP